MEIFMYDLLHSSQVETLTTALALARRIAQQSCSTYAQQFLVELDRSILADELFSPIDLEGGETFARLILDEGGYK